MASGLLMWSLCCVFSATGLLRRQTPYIYIVLQSTGCFHEQVLFCSIYCVTSEVCNYGVASFQRIPRCTTFVISDLLEIGLHTAACAALDRADRLFVLDKRISTRGFYSTLDPAVCGMSSVFIFVS